jgi:molecular chaperone GrpE
MTEEPKNHEESKTQLETLICDLDVEKKRSEECLTKLKYVQADFENLKKRTDRQIEEVKKYCTEHLVTELLEVVDELEMAVKSGRSSNSLEALIQGVEMTLKKLEKVLKNEGVIPIECSNKPFNPSKHNAIDKIEKSDLEDCTVIEEIRKGYVMNEKVIRPSIVKIAVKPLSKPQKESCSDE